MSTRNTPEEAGQDPRRDLRYGLEEALDGEVPPELAERMTAHTADCPECAAEVERLRRLKELVRRSCCDTPAPSGLRDRIALQCRTVTVTSTDADGTTVSVTRTSWRS